MEVETEVSKFDAEETEVEESGDEGKKKSKKPPKKGKKRRDERPTIISIPVRVKPPEVERTLTIKGVKNFKMTSLTQKIMGCIVGEHVTAEAPWTTISKVMVDENLYLHHESSDFLPLKDDLAEYTDSTILVGYDPDYMPKEGEDFHKFFAAVTEQAKEEILAQLEEEKRLAEERLKNSINKKILPWKSLGSEVEVDESIVKNTRPLIQLELETDIDELLKPVNFSDRTTDDVKDGYVRIGPGRHEFQGVMKMRVDAAIQSVPPLTPNSAQTDPGLPSNVWTQYTYDMKSVEEALKTAKVKELKPNYVFPEQNYMEKSLEYNEHIDLYVDDYRSLVIRESDNEVPHKSIFDEYEAFTDVTHTKNKLISSIAWHPMWSGIVALAYAVAVRCASAADVDSGGDEVSRHVFSKNSVLLWSFKDALKPRLILESPREVHALSWAPIDPNILIGGCASGQIIIWDLKGKLEAVEGHEYLTPDQQRYRLLMQGLIGWLQPQPPPQYVRPAALSSLQFSHAGRITQIQWLPPTLEWTDKGHLVIAEANEKPSMQFLTTGEDGIIRVWDLNKAPEDPGGNKPKKRKARKRPSALTAQISPFKVYDRKFRPIYILYTRLEGKTVTKLTGLSFMSLPIKYELSASELYEKETMEIKESQLSKKHLAKEISQVIRVEEGKGESAEKLEEEGEPKNHDENEERKKESEVKMIDSEKTIKIADSLEDFEVDLFTIRRKYSPVISPPLQHSQQLIQVVSDEGDSVILKWEGFDFHKGEEITTEEAKSVSWSLNFHDGPVVTCVRSPFMEDLVLTIGGRVIALWTHYLKDRPFFWKFSPVTVTCGSWSPYRPCLFHVGRSDGSIEVWDLTKQSDAPSLVQSISGKILTFMSEHSLPLYGEKAILGVADYKNSFRLLFFPDEYKIPKPDELETLKEFVKREITLREIYITWNEGFSQSNAEELAKIKEEELEAERKHKEAELAAEQEAQLRAKLEEEEAKQLSKGRNPHTVSERFFERLRHEREKQMQRVLMEKKRLNKSDLIAKQEPILKMKQMEKEKRKKQREKIRHQQKIFDKTIATLFPEVIEKPEEGSSQIDEFEAELMEHQPKLLAQYEELLPSQLKIIKDNPFNKRLKWEKVFEEGMFRRNVLDFSLYLRKERMDRYVNSKLIGDLHGLPSEIRKGKVKFMEEAGGEYGEEGEEEDSDEDDNDDNDDDDKEEDEAKKETEVQQDAGAEEHKGEEAKEES